MKGLQIGKAINAILAEENIQKVFPIVADEGTTFPFIVYRRIGLQSARDNYTKDRFYDDTRYSRVEVLIADTNYKGCLELADKVADILVKTRGIFNGIKIREITLEDADEDYIEDTFIQKLIFNIEIV